MGEFAAYEGNLDATGMRFAIAVARFNKDITEIYWATQPFLIVSLVAVIVIAFWPSLSLMLLR